jgi:hypothetical protein
MSGASIGYSRSVAIPVSHKKALNFTQGLEFAMKTRAAVVMLAALLTPGPSYATGIICFELGPLCSITYEHPFSLEGEEFHIQEWRNKLPTPYDLWTIPPFDSSLGIPDVLVITIEGTATISGRIHDLAGATEVTLIASASTLNLQDGSPHVIADAFASCTAAPCDFSSGPSPFGDITLVFRTFDGSAWQVPWWDADPQPTVFTLPIPYWSTDTFFVLQNADGIVALPITVRTHLNGVARASYIYAPVPEPSTLLLLGGGLLGAAWKRKRRQSAKSTPPCGASR